MLGDAELIEGCLSQDTKAQRMLYNKYASTMFGICLRYCKHRAEAEDILQEAFVKIFTHLKTYRNEGSFEGWLKRIVVNTALNYYKSQLKRCFNEVIDERHESLTSSEFVPGNDISAEELLKLINSLADGYRIVFNLYAVEGYSHKEIAAMLNISENTSKSQLSRARGILQEKINAYRKIMINP
ncbi:MAG: ECF RNA polymerase sigma-E factor [Bacteroidetes bacterium ADurb.Bin408]|nr:MAG: ECF RNA polymerase sigma-E factor [Bacteroidetes bacterium ADurb.Bin408]